MRNTVATREIGKMLQKPPEFFVILPKFFALPKSVFTCEIDCGLI